MKNRFKITIYLIMATGFILFADLSALAQFCVDDTRGAWPWNATGDCCVIDEDCPVGTRCKSSGSGICTTVDLANSSECYVDSQCPNASDTQCYPAGKHCIEIGVCTQGDVIGMPCFPNGAFPWGFCSADHALITCLTDSNCLLPGDPECRLTCGDLPMASCLDTQCSTCRIPCTNPQSCPNMGAPCIVVNGCQNGSCEYIYADIDEDNICDAVDTQHNLSSRYFTDGPMAGDGRTSTITGGKTFGHVLPANEGKIVVKELPNPEGLRFSSRAVPEDTVNVIIDCYNGLSFELGPVSPNKYDFDYTCSSLHIEASETNTAPGRLKAGPAYLPGAPRIDVLVAAAQDLSMDDDGGWIVQSDSGLEIEILDNSEALLATVLQAPGSEAIYFDLGGGDTGLHVKSGNVTVQGEDGSSAALGAGLTLAVDVSGHVNELVDVCGNYVVEQGEQCDDGNAVPDDCCDAFCRTEGSGNSCSDGDICNGQETCNDAGICLPGEPLSCDDGNVCTDDSCDPTAGCINTQNTAPCDDADICTEGDTCSGGLCIAGPPQVCNDGEVCTEEGCVPIAEACQGDFNEDGDVDGSSLAVFANEFNRNDCLSGPPCYEDFDKDGQVGESDLGILADNFGRPDCL